MESKITVGAKLHSNQRGLQELVRTKDGFMRSSVDGKKEFFNSHGKLKEIRYKSGHTISLVPGERKNDKELKVIKDSSGRQIFFQWWYSTGQVKEIYSSKDSKATYVYKGKALEKIYRFGRKYLSLCL